MINHFIKYPKMASKTNNKWSSTFVSLTASVLLLVGGCDGGIFGTGDGDNPPIVVPVGTEDLGENPVVTDGMQNLPDNVGLSFITSDSIGTFNNNENTTNRSDAQIKLINASPNENLGIIAINNNMIEAPLIPLPGITSTNRVSGYLTLENPANAITLFTAADATREEFSMPIASIDPITLAAGSATTLLLRGIRGNTDTPLELLAVSTKTTDRNDSALIRIVHAGTGLRVNADISLKPATSTDQAEELIITTDFGYSQGVTEYAQVLAGSYELIVRDSDDQRQLLTESESISLSTNEVVTLVILDQTNQAESGITVLRIQDSGL